VERWLETAQDASTRFPEALVKRFELSIDWKKDLRSENGLRL
jgi:hypothetical protein